jgi:hypothetical protein
MELFYLPFVYFLLFISHCVCLFASFGNISRRTLCFFTVDFFVKFCLLFFFLPCVFVLLQMIVNIMFR